MLARVPSASVAYPPDADRIGRGAFVGGSAIRDAVVGPRRTLIAALACGLLTVRSAVRARTPGRLVRIGWLSTRPLLGTLYHSLFIEAMRERGWIDGRHFVIEFRSSEGREERLPALAAELVQLNPDLIISSASPTTAAAKRATTTIPTLFFGVGDPVAAGFVASLSRPGGNLTGLGGLGAGVSLKQLDLLREIAPKAPRIA
ncbi:MAG: ABC transporter substrate binding protein, partial [Caldimonas sp.]